MRNETASHRAPIADHPQRYALANELHARPFPAVEAPCTAALLAVKQDGSAEARDRDADRAHLVALLDRAGADHPPPGATHYYGDIGHARLKWESHTEFVTYTAFSTATPARAFDPAQFDVFPRGWLAEAPGERVTSALIRVDFMPDDEDEIPRLLADWFVPESLAASHVLDGTAIVASDFRIDAAGHMRIAIFVRPGTGSRRIGRLVQRLCEVETYKTMSMLGLSQARALGSRMGSLDARLSELMAGMTSAEGDSEETLKALLGIASELENLLVKSSFRFGATGAYEALVHQRIEVLREERFGGRQTMAEFMMRRFDPAMRTVKSAERRLANMAERANRAGSLLGTRVDVERSAQNQELLEGMNRRAELQLKLQRTVEGLSVVAISYYGVNLASNLVAPPAAAYGIGQGAVMAMLTPVVVLAVWLLIRRLRSHLQ